jgi:hypothetical protein
MYSHQCNMNRVKKGIYSCIERHLDNVYLNVVFQNSTPNTELIAEYNVTKTLPILDKPSNYFAAVVRFDVPLNSVPLFVIPIVPNQVNPNLTPFTFTINASSTNVIYVPDNTYTAPIQNQQTQVITPYYYVYSFQNLINAFNTALAASYVAAGSPGGAGAPFFIFNPVTQLLGLVVSVAFITAGATIIINQALTNYLEGFELIFNVATNTFQFVLKNNGNNGFNLPGNTIAVASPPTWLIMSQEYTSMEYWLSLRKIVLISNTIPITFEYIPAFDTAGNPSAVATSIPILTDFVPNIEDAAQSRSIAVYNPTAQYRLIDMIGDSPLQTIDLRIYWQDKLGNYYPIFIEPFQQASVKIGFFRRDLYENGNPNKP